MVLHCLDADGGHIPDLHAQHFAAGLNDLPVTLGSKLLVLKLLHKAGNFHIRDAHGAHPGGCLNDARQLIHGKEGLFHVRHRLHIVQVAIAMGQDRPDLLRSKTLRQQFLFGVLQMVMDHAKVRMGLSMAAVPMGLLTLLLPTKLIGVCMNQHMRCVTLTRPALLILGIAVMAVAGLSAFALSKVKE